MLTHDQIHYMFAGIGNDSLDKIQQLKLYNALQLLPEEIANFATEMLWFVSTTKSTWAFCQRLSDLKKTKAIIFFSQELWKQDQEFINECVAHEIAHAWLNHPWNVELKNNAKLKENQANKLAGKWLGRKINVKESNILVEQTEIDSSV